jgi:hypothetical protein
MKYYPFIHQTPMDLTVLYSRNRERERIGSLYLTEAKKFFSFNMEQK